MEKKIAKDEFFCYLFEIVLKKKREEKKNFTVNPKQIFVMFVKTRKTEKKERKKKINVCHYIITRIEFIFPLIFFFANTNSHPTKSKFIF